jgi:hypothetical protein
MKTLLSYLVVAALILASSFTVNQQQQLNQQQSAKSAFDSFRVHKSKANVSLSWRVSSTDITQFIIERSNDGEHFEKLNTVDFNGSSNYIYKAKEKYSGRIYYRIAAVTADGTTAHSSITSIGNDQHENKE